MQLPTNLLTFLLTTSSLLSLITATPIATPSKQSASKTNPINSSIPAWTDPNTTNHIHTETETDPSDPAIAFFSSLPPPSSPPNSSSSSSSPNPSSPSTTGLTKRSSGNNKDHCRGGGYFNATSPGSPLVADCKVIIQNISPRGGTWHYMSGTQRTLVSHGSCALGIESTPDVPKGLQTLVGDLDISEWIRKSIDRYQWKGKVGSYGDTQCVSQTFKGDEYTLRWGLYHS